jgi:hypothetical protein
MSEKVCQVNKKPLIRLEHLPKMCMAPPHAEKGHMP